MPIIIVHGFHRLSNFLGGQKVTKEPPEPRFRSSSYSSRVFSGPRALKCATPSWPFDWQLYEASGGNRRYVPYLCRAAVATGVDGVFLEVHDDPDHGKSDGPNMLELSKLKTLLQTLVQIHKVVEDEI